MANVVAGREHVGPASVAHGNGAPRAPSSSRSSQASSEEEEENETELHLKRTKLTGRLAAVYRNGDSTSTLLVSGNRLLTGTHNGNIHVLSIPTLETVRHYHAHSASITDLCVSPYTSILSPESPRAINKASSERPSTPLSSTSSRAVSQASPSTLRPTKSAAALSQLYIATSSIDGHVCVSSLHNHKDVTLRNFARPVQAVALSPDFQNDRTYVSGGAAGSLILTVGGRQGVSADATTNNATAAASGWLGSMGLGTGNGKDVILHSGEGKIGNIRWSLSGKYIVWVNESGIKIMRSHLHQDSSGSDTTWKRFGHINKPKRSSWEELASVARPRVQWIDETCLEDDASQKHDNDMGTQSPDPKSNRAPSQSKKHLERLLVGWADTVWIIHVTSEEPRSGRPTLAGKAVISNMFNFPDGIVSGLSLYSPSLLMAIVFRTMNDEGEPLSSVEEHTPRRGFRRRQNGLPPDLRLIDLEDGNNEKEVQPLDFSQYENLSSSDYHLSCVFLPRSKIPSTGRGAFSSLGDGLWDIGVNATKIFGSSASVLSGSSNSEGLSVSATGVSTPKAHRVDTGPVLSSHTSFDAAGQKVFVSSPFDCYLVVKTDIADHFQFLVRKTQFDEAWELLNSRPEIASVISADETNLKTDRPKPEGERADEMLDDDRSLKTIRSTDGLEQSAVDRERERLGDLWIRHLIAAQDWPSAGDIAGKVLESSSRWAHWVEVFVENDKIDQIAFQMPTTPLRPPISGSLYDKVLRYYLQGDLRQMRDLLMQWHPDIYNVPKAIDDILASLDLDHGSLRKRSQQDWLICQDALALLYLADGRPSDAIECFIHTKNADGAIGLIREHNLLSTVSDKVYEFTLLRTSLEQQSKVPLSQLDDLTSETISLLALAALQDIIQVESVVRQLKPHSSTGETLLFFYFRALWQGLVPSMETDSISAELILNSRPRFSPAKPLSISRTRHLLALHGDLAIDLFAQYARDLLSDLLRSSDSSSSIEDTVVTYNYDHAVSVCESRHYIPELVHLLAITGQTRRALNLIVGDLGDVAQAIDFVRDVADDGLWNDLSEFCLADAHLIKEFLQHIDVGTGSETIGIDPKQFVKRIPNKLAIPGLRDALTRLVHENEVQYSVATGASSVLQSEVAVVLNLLRRGRAKGVMFEVEAAPDIESHCALCNTSFASSDSVTENDDALLGYSCGHVFHLPCLLDDIVTADNKSRLDRLRRQLLQSHVDERESGSGAWKQNAKVGGKMTRTRMITPLLEGRRCVVCERASSTGTSGTGTDPG
ncbi:MAG: Vacuolar protein sorting-associated protein 41 [Chrysothrix sp. TS-e1954]|nr:MAG: Vacuolar protein sorting-associated protein 41 [Chrysothrix sp. TS-e1954]